MQMLAFPFSVHNNAVSLLNRSNILKTMKFKLNLLSAVTVFGLLVSSLPASVCGHEIASEMTDSANHLLQSLTPKQKATLVFPLDDKLRKDWQFIPMEREGLSLKNLKPNQRLLAMSLIQTALSHRGYSTSLQIMALEQILHEMENNSPKRDPEKYHLFLFGTPSLKTPWGWRIEGHHLSISVTVVKNEVVVTPAFFGSNPGEVQSGQFKGVRVLGKEEDLGRTLVKALTADQQTIAVFSEKAPRDVINGPGREATALTPKGLSAAKMTKEQKLMLRQIVDAHLNKCRAELAANDWKKIEAGGFDELHFAWAGELERGKPHYYRVQGPSFILEYDNTQNKANHVHAVWRDFKNDFGQDLLKQHYQANEH
jgi:hypothetical protein